MSTLPAYAGVNHECQTYDGRTIYLGLRVRDYDNRVGMVVAAPRDYELADPTCWPAPGHAGHWWEVCSDRAGHVHELGKCRGAMFDGSRMTTRDVDAPIGSERAK